ncbi:MULTISPECIES: hypothetical protein [Methylosinus]|uniref:Uncharacterized protein n=1 Tax=Methylosinus trichosporium (strain ATCC 35070 / NCIMB 11131 / UNIQEM 75 / OB3b) TaxID=595536 RepID=A0A2D2D0F0_METT3|nr:MULTISPECIES: hypothetical protein [Methylosinus]ATQ68465.1 hypothetical protein CQW49_11690 [Methylosinus trichosporium OB3b]
MSATLDEFLYRISCMYFLPCQDREKPDRAWLDGLFRKHPPTMFDDEEDIARLRYVLCCISRGALIGSVGSRPTAKQRKEVSKCVAAVDSAYKQLRNAIEEVPFGFRPRVECRRDPQLDAVDEWLARQGERARGRGNAKDHWWDSHFTTLLGFYDFAYGLHWRMPARCRAGNARPNEIIGARTAPATFIRAYLTAVKSLLQSCDFIPEKERAALNSRWFVPTIAALTSKMATLRRGHLECTLWEPVKSLGPTEIHTLPDKPSRDARSAKSSKTSRRPRIASEDQPRVVSVAQKIWLEAGGTIPVAVNRVE